MLATATVATWRDGRSECEKIGGEKAPALLMATAKTAAEGRGGSGQLHLLDNGYEHIVE